MALLHVRRRWWSLLLLALVVLFGCGAETPIEPRMLDGGGEPRTFEDRPATSGVPFIEDVSLDPVEPLPGDVVHASARVVAPGSYELSYSWTFAGHAFDGDVPAVTLPELRKGDPVVVSVVASNGSGASEPVRLEVRVGNRPPRLTQLRVHEQAGRVGESEAGFIVETRGIDPDAEALAYEYVWLVNEHRSHHRDELLPRADLEPGDRIRVRVRVGDGDDWSDFAESGTIRVENFPPQILSTPPGLDATGSFHYAIQVEDRDDDADLRYALSQAPPGMKLDPMTGELHWEPGRDQVGQHTIELSVEDRHGGRAEQSFRLSVAAARLGGEVGRSGEPVPAARR